MEKRERFSEMTSSVRVGRCAISTGVFLSVCVRYMTHHGQRVLLDGTLSTRPGCCARRRAGRQDRGRRDDERSRGSDAATLRGAAAVVCLRRDVLDRADLEARRGERTDRGLTAGAGALDED